MDQESFALAGEGEEGWDEALRGAKNSTVTHSDDHAVYSYVGRVLPVP